MTICALCGKELEGKPAYGIVLWLLEGNPTLNWCVGCLKEEPLIRSTYNNKMITGPSLEMATKAVEELKLRGEGRVSYSGKRTEGRNKEA